MVGTRGRVANCGLPAGGTADQTSTLGSNPSPPSYTPNGVKGHEKTKMMDEIDEQIKQLEKELIAAMRKVTELEEKIAELEERRENDRG